MQHTCEPGKPGPHHYDCGRPTDGQVHCVCLKCGDEKWLPAAGEDLPKGSRPSGYSTPGEPEDKSVTNLTQIEAKIEDETVPDLVPAEDETSTESVPVEIQEKEEVAMPRLSLVQARKELEAKKDFVIETWHRCDENVAEAARVLEIAKSTLYGKLKQWGVVVPTPRRRQTPQQVRFEDEKERIIATYLKTKSARSADGHSATKAAKKLGMHISTLRQKLAQWGILPTIPSRMPRGRPRSESGAVAEGKPPAANRLLVAFIAQRQAIVAELAQVHADLESMFRIIGMVKESIERKETLDATLAKLDVDIKSLERVQELLSEETELTGVQTLYPSIQEERRIDE